MVNARVEKKAYSPPAFDVVDIHAAKADLLAKTASNDAVARQMLSVIGKQLGEKKQSTPKSGPRHRLS